MGLLVLGWRSPIFSTGWPVRSLKRYVSNFLKVNSFEITVFHSLNINKGIVTPESELRYVFVQRINAKRHPLSWSSIIHFQL